MQTVDIGRREERPIAYHGRLLLPREMRYCARRREFLAIVELVQYFLSGVHFTIRTDHDSLKGVKQLDKLTGQMARWIEYLSCVILCVMWCEVLCGVMCHVMCCHVS